MLSSLGIISIALVCIGLGVLLFLCLLNRKSKEKVKCIFIFQTKILIICVYQEVKVGDVENGGKFFTTKHSRHQFPFLSWLHPQKECKEDGHNSSSSQPQPSHQSYEELQMHKNKLNYQPLDYHPGPGAATLDSTESEGDKKKFQDPVKSILKPREIIIRPGKLPQSHQDCSHLTLQGFNTQLDLTDKQTKKPGEIVIRPNKKLTSVSKASRKIQLLSKLAIRKHIHPECKTNADAIHISEERDRFSSTDTNHVFKISPADFKEIESVSVLNL